MSSAFRSPLRYPGGKRRLANFFKLLMVENRLVGRPYVEAYAGGASVALAMLFEEYASEVYINDLNAGVHAFWSSALKETRALCEKILDTPVTIEEWHRQREVFRGDTKDELALGFATFFLNRTNRSGIIAGGVIGGLDQSGPWKLDARFNKEDLVARIRKIGRFAPRIHLLQREGIQLTQELLPQLEGSPLVYFDPPYFVKGGDLYQNSYEPGHHVELAAAIRLLEIPWVVSYDAAPEIVDIYSWARETSYSITYSAGERGRGTEVMYLSAGLRMPDVRTPVMVPASRVNSALMARL